MDMLRFEQFKQDSNMVLESSMWLTQEIDKIIDEEVFYTENPDLDTYELMEQRYAKMNELQNRADIESKINADHHRKYKDLYDADF